ncbi:hypothetical protein GDO81_012304 [Engystomops pustulosus]|uniref:Non-syndromic hearing impairment protein 5 n=1 Tax=Engystomops pustulosus TaxID=76066 RepID=A0AAV7BKV5_ENGPU|nr:hypothetical protein GDO81_012304 [Engystomops pustulosus]
MFAKATKNFLRDIDAGGELISVSSLNDSDKTQLLSVVAKKRRFWCWQKPKYFFSSCACLLGDVLTEEGPVKPVVVESEFVKYEDKYSDTIQGNVDAEFVAIQGNVGGSEKVESQFSFGTLRKQEVDMQHLMKDVQVTESGNVKDENTVLEIPPPTAIAYSVVELYVKHDGHFEFCLLSEKQGGFEKKLSERSICTSSGFCDSRSLCDFDVVDGLRDRFAVFQELPESQREELYNLLCEVLDDGQTVAQLQTVVEEICLGSKPGLPFLSELKSPQKEHVQKILSLVGYDLHNQKPTQQCKKHLMAAFHVLTSALDEMPDTALTIFGACCKLHLLPALCALPNITSDEGLCSRTEPLLSDLIDQGTFQIVQRLFSLCNMKLEMNEKVMCAITFKDPGFLPLVLYIALSGFHALIKNLRI